MNEDVSEFTTIIGCFSFYDLDNYRNSVNSAIAYST